MASPLHVPAATSSTASSFLGQPMLIRTFPKISFRPHAARVPRCVATDRAEKTVYRTKVVRNENMAKLQAGYLFPEVD